MAAPTLAEMRTRVRERMHASSNDPMFTDSVVNRRINMAYGDVLSGVQPNGWWWQQVEQTLQNTSGGDLAQMPVVLATPNNARSIRKVYSVFASTDNDYWLPVAQRERTDQVRLAGGVRVASGLPLSWSALPSPTTVAGVRRQLVLVFDPPLANLTFVRFQCVVDAADLTADSSVLVGIPPILSDLVCEQAVNRLIRQQRSVGNAASKRAMAAKLALSMAACDGWTTDARRYFNSAAAGAGFGELHDRTYP